MGSGVSLNYRGTPQFGTILGGCLSLLVSIFFALFVGLTLFAWAFRPDYKYQKSVDYLKVNSTEVYDVQTSVFLPTFILLTDDSINDDEQVLVANDRNLFEFKFIDWNSD